mmetsp:Transcript_10692/g.28031  ORF Transcript_10692/g.28031 Transcript_10692/m.28031 type:complete len:125 (+) Transcript_10692:412-786(+)
MALDSLLNAQQLRDEVKAARRARRFSIQSVNWGDVEERDRQEVKLPRKRYFPRTRGLLSLRLAALYFMLGDLGKSMDYLETGHAELHGAPDTQQEASDEIAQSIAKVGRFVSASRLSCASEKTK